MRNLIQLASADGHLDDSEVAVLFEIGKQRHLKEWQITELLKDQSTFEVFIPESFINKMNLLFDLMRLIYADGVVDETEIIYIKRILSAFNLSHDVMTELFILFKNGIPAMDEWREFTDALSYNVSGSRPVTIL